MLILAQLIYTLRNKAELELKLNNTKGFWYLKKTSPTNDDTCTIKNYQLEFCPFKIYLAS